MDLGIYGIALPFEDSDKAIVDTIKLRTIKTFSIYSPDVVTLRDTPLNTFKCLRSEYSESVYEIPDMFGGRHIMFIQAAPRNKLMGSSYLDPILNEPVDMFGAIMMAQANQNLASAIVPPFTTKFESPNILHVYNMTALATELDLTFGLEHLPNLSTIKKTAWESFYNLALLDVKRLLYNILKHHNEIQTAYGNINLRIDDWANAESERKELLEKWDADYHMQFPQFLII